VALDLAWFSQLIVRRNCPGSVSTVVDHNGTILTRYPESEMGGTILTRSAIIQAILANQREGTVEAPGIDGVPRLYAFTSAR
jgi:hypothetical protein